MRYTKSAIAIATIGILAFGAPASAADWGSPQSASTGNLGSPSMVADSNGFQNVVARGDTGIWYITNKSGSFVRTRLTQDFYTEGGSVKHYARAPLIAINAQGVLTVVYAMTLAAAVDDICLGVGLRYIVREHGSWSHPKRIPGPGCEEATGLVVHGSTIAVAAFQGTHPGGTAVDYVTNASGSWTHALVAAGTEPNNPFRAGLTMYDGKPMLAYIRSGYLIYARGRTNIGDFTHEKAVGVEVGAGSQPSVAINDEWPMIAWTQADGTHYAYKNSNGWYSYRVMPGSGRAVLAFDGVGHPHIVAADRRGGLWYAKRYGGAWHSVQLDDHIVFDVGGIGFGAHLSISYVRAAHLYSRNTDLYAIIATSCC